VDDRNLFARAMPLGDWLSPTLVLLGKVVLYP